MSLPPLAPIWADDIAVAFDDSRPAGLVQKAKTITSVILDALTSAGLKPNLKSGKTELLLDLRGQGSQESRRQICLNDNVLEVSSDYEPYHINVVGSYRHLGTWIQVRGGLAKDVSTKMAIAHQTITRFRTQIFGNRGMELKIKLRFYESLIQSAIIFNAAVWRPRNQRQYSQLEAGFFPTASTTGCSSFWCTCSNLELQNGHVRTTIA